MWESLCIGGKVGITAWWWVFGEFLTIVESMVGITVWWWVSFELPPGGGYGETY